MNTLFVLFKTEFKLAVREFSGVLFGVILPVGIMILLGALYGSRPAYDGAGYTSLQQSFAAVITIGICATGLMGIPLTVANYREKKILKRFQVTPTSPMMFLAAQILNNLVFALISSFLVWVTARLFFSYTMIGSLWLFLLFYCFVTVAIYALGMLVASVSGNIKTANLLTTVVYFPMFFLSGATVPYEIMPKALQMFSSILPLNHGIKLLKAVSLNLPLEQFGVSLLVLGITAIAGISVSLKTFRWE